MPKTPNEKNHSKTDSDLDRALGGDGPVSDDDVFEDQHMTNAIAMTSFQLQRLRQRVTSPNRARLNEFRLAELIDVRYLLTKLLHDIDTVIDEDKPHQGTAHF